MVEERITRSESADGETHTHTTVITDKPQGGGKSWMFMIALLIAVAGGIYVFSQMGGAEIAKDTAIADAADQVGDAATKAGDAVERVADEVTPAE